MGYRFDLGKDARLRARRGLGFAAVIEVLKTRRPLWVRRHRNQARYPGQWLAAVEVAGYVYLVPFDQEAGSWRLRTIYPSRQATRAHRKASEG